MTTQKLLNRTAPFSKNERIGSTYENEGRAHNSGVLVILQGEI